MISEDSKTLIDALSEEELRYEVNLGRRSRFQREKFAYVQTRLSELEATKMQRTEQDSDVTKSSWVARHTGPMITASATKIVYQKQDELSQKQSQRMDRILKDSSSKGWNIPPGHVHRELDDLQVDSIRRRGEIVWSALEQTLEAFDPSFYPELGDQLHSLAESFFPLTLCKPHDYLRRMGCKRSFAEEANQQLRSQLEIARKSSLERVKTKIDLYVANKRSKSIGGELSPLESELQKKWDNGNTSTITILFLAADPGDATRLRIGEEFREIQEKLKLSKFRNRFRLKLPQLSVRAADISQALLDTEPQIVHFSGHGATTGALCFENQQGQTHLVQSDALAALYEQFSNEVNCVLLNACYSETQAKAIAEYIEYVIGMNKAFGDKAAIAFAIGFYQALGAGRTIEDAFKLGCVQIRLQGISEHLTPVLIKNGQIL